MDITTPIVSVLMPTFNQQHFVRRALDSLLAQTLTDWELILINDGCTDATEHVIQLYLSDRRIRYNQLTQNQGWEPHSIMDWIEQLRDRSRLSQLQENVWQHRDRFTFDAHCDRLIEFFHQVKNRATQSVPERHPQPV